MTSTTLAAGSFSRPGILSRLVRTENDHALALIRLALGLVMFPHGAQKVLGWFGGYGFTGTMGFFTDQLHLPAVLAFLVIVAEFGGSLALLTGLGSRLGALGVLAVMAGAVTTVHGSIGFFMNWYGQYPAGTEGFEFHILAGVMALVVLVRGGGAWSVDRAITR